LRADGKSVADTEGTWKAGLANDKGERAIAAVAIAGAPSLGAKWIFDGAQASLLVVRRWWPPS
jgi:hypothetical protein